MQLLDEYEHTRWAGADPSDNLILLETPQSTVSDLEQCLLGTVPTLQVRQVEPVASHQLVQHLCA